MYFVKVISSDNEIKQFCYEPLKSGCIYKAEFENKYYRRVFFSYDGEEYDIVVHIRHLRELDLDEIREFKLNELGV